MPPSPRRSCQADLTLDLAAPRTSRTLLELLLPQWGVTETDTVDGASLVLSELVTHALGASDDGGPVTIGVELHDDAVRLWVQDRSPAVPVQRGPRVTADDARGLVIVGQLSSRWGVEPHEDGLRSYADVPLTSVACG